VWFLKGETYKDEDEVDGRQIRRIRRVLNRKVTTWYNDCIAKANCNQKNSNQKQKKKETEQEQRK
jgi:hypothetical protein